MNSGGLLVAFEGGEGAGKSTQTGMLRDWLESMGHTVCVTFEPGDTAVGKQLRQVLLGRETGTLAPRTEALLYAADRAEHVATVIRPALARGEIVVTDRYVDSSLAYQGAGRELDVREVEWLSHWAAEGTWPDLIVLLDIDPTIGLSRGNAPADRLEAEPLAFHQRVRQQFLNLTERDPSIYLVIDATEPAGRIHMRVLERMQELLE